jgi:mitochondrial fission protein ELM1
MRSQVLGLGEALGVPFEEKIIEARPPFSYLPPFLLPEPKLAIRDADKILAPPWPDLVITSGRRAVFAALAIRQASKGRTKLVHIQNPVGAVQAFDLVISMRHDGVIGDNVLTVDTALHRVTPIKLVEGARAFRSRFASLPRPLIGVVLGGRNRHYRFTIDTAEMLIAQLRKLQKALGAGVAITASRRTEPEIVERFKTFSRDAAGVFMWNNEGENPYFGILGLADALIVTEDSVSMVSEAIATGKPVATVALKGHAKRHKVFIDRLIEKGAISRFTGVIPPAPRERQPDPTMLAVQRIQDLFNR